ncbi:MAG: PA14 domain-containing protein, partial [Deltaproteobacteria bacterium]|nr:PA14 domain-containing protein [Deltaproteobacteria bacterium]
MRPGKSEKSIPVVFLAITLAIVWAFPCIGYAETVDLLPFFCPACVGEGTNQRNLVGGECFYTYPADVKGRSGFYVVKSCGDKTVYEEFAYDGNNIYHLADTSWATWNGSSWTAAKCYDGRIAYSTYLNGNFGSQNGSCDGFNPNMGNEGNIWVPRHMNVGEQTDNLPTTIVAMAKDNCSCCQAQYTGPTGRWVKLVSKEPMDLGIGVGTKDVVRIAIMDGPGKGENFWYARNYGWVAFGQIDPPDGNLSFNNVTHIHGVDNSGQQRQATCGGTPPVQPPGNCINSVLGDRWKGEYFNNENLSGSPSMVKDDGNGLIDYDWGYGGPSACGVGTDNFSVRWTRQINFPAGLYTFKMTVDDGGRLYIDGDKKLDQWKTQPPTEYSAGPFSLSGTHTVVFEYYEHNVGAVAKLRWDKVGDIPQPPSTGFNGSTGWENGEPEGSRDEVMYSQSVGAYPGGSKPECSRVSGEQAKSGGYSLRIAGNSQADYAYCYYRVFDNLSIPVTNKTKIGYYIYHSAGTPQVAVDGYFTDGSSIRDSGIKDQNNVPIHPSARNDAMNQWVYVEADLSPAAGKTIKTLMFAFDNGGNKYHGPYRTYVDDLRVFEGGGGGGTCLAAVPENRWKGEYFNNENLTGSPSMVKDDGDGLITNDWGMGGPNACGIGTDNFSVRWTRKVDFPPGLYTFKMTVDDGGRLYIDGDKKLDQWKTQPPTEYSTGSIALSGIHTVSFEYFEHNVGAVAKLRWDKVGELPITTCQANVPGNRWKGEYFNNQDLSGLPAMIKDDGDGALNKQWGAGSPGSDCGIGADHFSVRWTKVQNFVPGMYTFTMSVDDGGRFYIDDDKKSDGWKDQAEAAYTTGQIALSGDHTLKLEYYENAGDATAKLSWVRVGDIPPDPNPTGKSKLSVQSAFAGGGNLTKGFVQQAQPIVVKVVDDMGQVPVVRQLAPNAIIIGRIVTDGFGVGQGNPEDKAVEFHNMIKGRMIGGVDYWEGVNEKKRVEILAAEGKKACIGTFSVGVPDVTDPTIWPAFYPAIDAAMAHGGAMCVHEYSAPTMKYAFNESNQNVYDAAPGTGYCKPGEGYLTGRYRRVYRQHLIPDNKVIPLFITECGLDGGVAGSAPSKPGWKVYYQNTECQGTDTDGVSKQAKCYFNDLVWYDNLIRQDDYVKGATIFSLEQPNWDNFDIGGDVLNLLTPYVKDGTAPEPITPPVTPPPVTPPPSTPSFSSGWEDAQRDGQPGVEMYRKEVIGYSNTSGSLPEVKRQSGEQVHGGSFALKASGTSKANYAYSYHKIYENLNLTITSGMKL